MNREIATVAPTGFDRVRARTTRGVNSRIDRGTRTRLEALADATTPELTRRLDELDREWDIDRSTIVAFSALGGLSFVLGVIGLRSGFPRRRWNGWLSLLAIQLPFLAMHGLLGWCPPSAVLRAFGFRTAKEIAVERASVASWLAEAHVGARNPAGAPGVAPSAPA